MPVSPPLTVKESDDSVSVRPTNVLSFNAGDFTVSGSGDTATISIDSTGTGAALTDTYIGFGNASNLLTGSANFTFTDESGGTGPTILLTGGKPILRIQDDDVGAGTDYYTEWQQSGASFYWFSKDSSTTNNEMFRVSNSYIAIQRNMTANVGIGGVPDSGIALDIKGTANQKLRLTDTTDDYAATLTAASDGAYLMFGEMGSAEDSWLKFGAYSGSNYIDTKTRTLQVTGTATVVSIESSDDGAALGPELHLWRNSASPAAADYAGGLIWKIENDAGAMHDISRIRTYLGSVAAGSESADLYWSAYSAGTEYEFIAIRGASRLVEFNLSNNDVDTVANAQSFADFFYLDASQVNLGVGGKPASAVERLHVKGTGTGEMVRFESTDDGASASPDLVFYRNSASPADDDYISQVSYVGRNDNSQDVTYVKHQARILDATDGSEDGGYYTYIMKAGTLRRMITMTSSGMYINNDGYDFNFAVNDNNDDALLNCDAGLRVVSVGSTAAVSGGATLQVPDNTISSYCNVQTVRSDGVATQTFINEDCQGQMWVNNSATDWAFDLPESTVKGQWFKFVSTGGNITVDPNPSGGTSNTLNGGTGALTRSTDNQVYTVICIDSNTWVMDSP